MDKPKVDWTKFEGFQRPLVTCACGTAYVTHCKHVLVGSRVDGVTERPCPGCGREFGHVHKAEHPPEQWTIGG